MSDTVMISDGSLREGGDSVSEAAMIGDGSLREGGDSVNKAAMINDGSLCESRRSGRMARSRIERSQNTVRGEASR